MYHLDAYLSAEALILDDAKNAFSGEDFPNFSRVIFDSGLAKFLDDVGDCVLSLNETTYYAIVRFARSNREVIDKLDSLIIEIKG